MYQANSKKTAIICIIDILKRHTDSDHTLTQKQIQDMLNPKALGKVINDTLGYPHQVNTYPFGNATNRFTLHSSQSATRKTHSGRL